MTNTSPVSPERASHNPANIAGFIALPLMIGLACTVPEDWGRYADVFTNRGLVGFVTMSSILVGEFWLVLAFAVCEIMGLRYAHHRGSLGGWRWFIATGSFGAIGAVAYIFGIIGIAYSASAGEFGYGSAAMFGLFLVWPGVSFFCLGIIFLPFSFLTVRAECPALYPPC